MKVEETKELIGKILESTKGILEEAEVFLVSSSSLTIEVYEKEISKYNIAESGGLSLRGIYKGKMGYSYTENISESSIDELIEGVKSNSLYIEGDEEFIQEGVESYEDVDKFDYSLEDVPVDKKIDLLFELEEKAGKLDERIDVKATAYQEVRQVRYIGNTRGIRLMDGQSFGLVYLRTVTNTEDVKTGMGYQIFKEFDKIDREKIIKDGIDSAVSKLNSSPVKSGEYKLVFDKNTFASLLSAFIPAFSAETVHDNLSLLKGKLGEKVASSVLTLVDDPFLEDGYGSQSFDDEGTETVFKELIKDGVLQTYMYNLKTARKDGIKSTGNASRSYKGPIGISHSNLYIVPGEMKKEEILKEMDGGLYIDSLAGLHSGLNPVSGDFSLSAEGYRIEDGKLAGGINQITVAGNLLNLLEDIIYVGEDLEFGLSGGGTIGSPTIGIKSLAVSGK